ncbi:ABC transporter permease [Paenibacillus baekrokdamisoli]|uniref:ABC transporter permease n=1 Tax=Paenibacillus baekrokdamisoli TaxID=1712516 RepID=A0A3G9J6K6_9BACL|nr:carbohydrate ABC transporter permease [Paenibacillus baekrokdamisoli]MBB3070400.1 multiple sugar transport system permease protein [Paenibacillus baekrokdamisoli]BBH21401.1 ABC transporter permease [Paenibacillus baekrokdamisoli]
MKAVETIRQMNSELNARLNNRQAQRMKKLILGQHVSDGLLMKTVIYFILAIIAFLYLQPLLYMISTMVKSQSDLIDPVVQWIPQKLHFGNLEDAWRGLKYPEAFKNTMMIALICSCLQVASCAITGYALARLEFPGKTIAFILIIISFLVPPQITIIPLYSIFSKLGVLNTPFVFIIPALFAQGLRGALFIIIFRQFFLTQPKALEEAAKIDGASAYRLFFKIMLPLARPAIIVVFLFSFVWYWNMYYEPSMFLNHAYQPLSIRLNMLEQELMGNKLVNFAVAIGKDPLTEGPKMAGAFLIIFPPLLVYLLTQRWFTEGIERTGMVE